MYASELTLYRAAHLIDVSAEAQGVTQAELARRLKKTEGFVSQCLSGSRNMTLRTFAEFLAALDLQISEFRVVQLGTDEVPRDRADLYFDKPPVAPGVLREGAVAKVPAAHRNRPVKQSRPRAQRKVRTR